MQNAGGSDNPQIAGQPPFATSSSLYFALCRFFHTILTLADSIKYTVYAKTCTMYFY
jgi:hypothetical protein